jgi:hypothetical protein
MACFECQCELPQCQQDLRYYLPSEVLCTHILLALKMHSICRSHSHSMQDPLSVYWRWVPFLINFAITFTTEKHSIFTVAGLHNNHRVKSPLRKGASTQGWEGFLSAQEGTLPVRSLSELWGSIRYSLGLQKPLAECMICSESWADETIQGNLDLRLSNLWCSSLYRKTNLPLRALRRWSWIYQFTPPQRLVCVLHSHVSRV